MSLYVFDTDTLTLFNRNHVQVSRQVAVHAVDDIVTTVITVEESLSGWYKFLRRQAQPAQIARAYRDSQRP